MAAHYPAASGDCAKETLHTLGLHPQGRESGEIQHARRPPKRIEHVCQHKLVLLGRREEPILSALQETERCNVFLLQEVPLDTGILATAIFCIHFILQCCASVMQ